MRKLSALSKFEYLAEKLFEAYPTHWAKGRLHPVELARKLAKAMEASKSFGVDKVYVPNRYEVQLNTEDFAAFASFRKDLENELSVYLEDLAKERGDSLYSRPVVKLQVGDRVGRRSLRVSAEIVDAEKVEQEAKEAEAVQQATQRIITKREGKAQPKAVLRACSQGKGSVISIRRLPFTMGRALDNDLVLEDVRISRRHAEIVDLLGELCLRDLGSTNGTFVNGQRIQHHSLRNRDFVSLGGVDFEFQSLEQ